MHDGVMFVLYGVWHLNARHWICSLSWDQKETVRDKSHGDSLLFCHSSISTMILKCYLSWFVRITLVHSVAVMKNTLQ